MITQIAIKPNETIAAKMVTTETLTLPYTHCIGINDGRRP